jgi:4-carboxymuconolactone decarboxylase
MARIPDLTDDEMSAEQRRIAAEIGGARGGVVRGPFAIWLRLPEIADRANQFGNALRVGGKLDRRLFELMILVVARQWSAQYEWFAHAETARKVGVTDAVIEAIRTSQKPHFVREDEQVVYDTVIELLESRQLSAATYSRAETTFGRELLIELITAAGFYTMVAMMLNAFEAPVPGGLQPLP